MEIKQTNIVQFLEGLLGTWIGEGIAEYPTTDTFHYRERLTFTMNEGRAYLHFNQRTWRKDDHSNEIPSHWETGFWRVLPGGEIELLSTQSSGRVEVAHGSFTPIENGFTLLFESGLIANDIRVSQTWREFTLQGNSLRYSMKMQTAAVSGLTLHIQSQLVREQPDHP